MTLNEAIFTALTAESKKDIDKETIRFIERFGLKVVKESGRIYIKNGDDKAIYFYEGYEYSHVNLNGKYTYRSIRFKTLEDCKKVDFAGFFRKPNNDGYHRRNETPRFRQRYENLVRGRNIIKYYENQIEAAELDIEVAKRKIADNETGLEAAKKKLEAIRREYNLGKENKPEIAEDDYKKLIEIVNNMDADELLAIVNKVIEKR